MRGPEQGPPVLRREAPEPRQYRQGLQTALGGKGLRLCIHRQTRRLHLPLLFSKRDGGSRPLSAPPLSVGERAGLPLWGREGELAFRVEGLPLRQGAMQTLPL